MTDSLTEPQKRALRLQRENLAVESSTARRWLIDRRTLLALEKRGLVERYRTSSFETWWRPV